MSAFITVNGVGTGPFVVSFGNVTTVQTYTVDVVLANVGDDPTEVASFLIDNPVFTTDIPVPLTLNPGDAIDFHVTFFPNTTPQSYTGNLGLNVDAVNDPIVIVMTGVGVAPGALLLGVDPSTWYFGNQKTGTTGAEKLFVLKNNGIASLTVTAITPSASFTLSTTPTLPLVMSTGQTATFGIKFAPSGGGLITGTASIVSDAVGSPLIVALSGSGQAITAANILTGVRGTLAAFATSGNVAISLFDPDNLDCEAEAFLIRLHDMQLPFVEKYLAKVQLDYEDLSRAVTPVNVRASTRRDVDSLTAVTVNGRGDNDIRFTMANVSASDEVILITIDRESGAVSLTEYALWFEVKGEIINP